MSEVNIELIEKFIILYFVVSSVLELFKNVYLKVRLYLKKFVTITGVTLFNKNNLNY